MSENVTEKLNQNQRRAIVALFECKSVTDAAEKIGLSRQTIYRYMQDPDFRKALNDASQSLVDATRARLLAGQEKALDKLDALIDRSKSESNGRLAAQAWMDLASKFYDHNVEERLTALESAYDNANRNA